MRKLIIVALSCSVFGGCIGALATAATQSQASPGAIAAAVQHVQDQQADTQLKRIDTKLGQLNGKAPTLSVLTTDIGDMDYTLWTTCRSVGGQECGPLVTGAP